MGIQGDQIEGERDVTRYIIDQICSRDVKGDQREGESGVTGGIIDDLHSSEIQQD